MSSRSIGELLLRPSSFTRIPHTSSTQCLRRITPSWTAQCCISTSKSQPSQPQRKDDAVDTEQEQQSFPSSRSIFSRPAPDSRRPPFAPRQQTTTSSDEIRAARASHVFGSEFASPSRNRPSRRAPALDFDSMSLPESILNPTHQNKPSDAASLATQQEETFANYPRLNPTYGRTVELDNTRGRDIVRGIGMLGSLMARNRIKTDFNKQRFHERGGLKRKRLNSERWRARFKKGFREVTGRVNELTRKGW